MQNFPRVEIPGLDVTPEGREVVANAYTGYKEWRGLKLGMALALIRTGHKPHVKPPKAVIEKRRKANRAARKARRA